MPDVEISVVCTNNRGALERCLAALPAACDGLSWAATVVDNAGTDGTSDMVRERYSWANLVRNDRRAGFSANHNVMLRRAVRDRRSRYVLILNDDTIFDPGALRAMVEEMDRRPELGALGPRLRGPDGAPQESLLQFPSTALLVLQALAFGRPHPASNRPGWLNGSCILFRVEALAQVGVLDERFFIFFEDTDIGLRLDRAGWRSAVAETAGMIHLEHQTVSTPTLNNVMARQMLRSQWLYAQKHWGPTHATALTGVVRGILLVRGLRNVKRARREDNPEIRATARHLVGLARYQTREPLPHEQRTS